MPARFEQLLELLESARTRRSRREDDVEIELASHAAGLRRSRADRRKPRGVTLLFVMIVVVVNACVVTVDMPVIVIVLTVSNGRSPARARVRDRGGRDRVNVVASGHGRARDPGPCPCRMPAACHARARGRDLAMLVLVATQFTVHVLPRPCCNAHVVRTRFVRARGGVDRSGGHSSLLTCSTLPRRRGPLRAAAG